MDNLIAYIFFKKNHFGITLKDSSNLCKKTATNKQVIEVDERRQQIANPKTRQKLNYYLYLSPNTRLLVPGRLT